MREEDIDIDIDDLENECPDDVEPVGDEAQLYEHFRVVVDKGQEMMRVDKYLFDRITNSSRNRIQKAADAGFVMANGKPVKSSYKVKPLDVITVMMDRPRYDNEVVPEDIPLNVVYEDDYVMVVNKPAGLVVHPGHGNWHGTLVNAIAWHLKDTKGYDANDPHLGLVHRIDKDTSGLLVIAKTADAKTNLGWQFFHKTTKRRYQALVWGNVEQDEGTVVPQPQGPPPDGCPARGGRQACRDSLSRIGALRLRYARRVHPRDGAYAPDTCAHEAHRPRALQRRTLRWSRNSERYSFCKIQNTNNL